MPKNLEEQLIDQALQTSRGIVYTTQIEDDIALAEELFKAFDPTIVDLYPSREWEDELSV